MGMVRHRRRRRRGGGGPPSPYLDLTQAIKVIGEGGSITHDNNYHARIISPNTSLTYLQIPITDLYGVTGQPYSWDFRFKMKVNTRVDGDWHTACVCTSFPPEGSYQGHAMRLYNGYFRVFFWGATGSLASFSTGQDIYTKMGVGNGVRTYSDPDYSVPIDASTKVGSPNITVTHAEFQAYFGGVSVTTDFEISNVLMAGGFT